MIEFTFDTEFILYNKKQISDWLLSLASSEGFTIKNLHYNFVSAEKIHSINNQFLNHDYPTDVIAFDYCEDKELSGEVFVCQKIVEQSCSQTTYMKRSCWAWCKSYSSHNSVMITFVKYKTLILQLFV